MPIPLILIWEVSRRGSIYACMTYLVNSFRCFYSLFLMLLPFQTVKTKFVVMKSESFVFCEYLSTFGMMMKKYELMNLMLCSFIFMTL